MIVVARCCVFDVCYCLLVFFIVWCSLLMIDCCWLLLSDVCCLIVAVG